MTTDDPECIVVTNDPSADTERGRAAIAYVRENAERLAYVADVLRGVDDAIMVSGRAINVLALLDGGQQLRIDCARIRGAIAAGGSSAYVTVAVQLAHLLPAVARSAGAAFAADVAGVHARRIRPDGEGRALVICLPDLVVAMRLRTEVIDLADPVGAR